MLYSMKILPTGSHSYEIESSVAVNIKCTGCSSPYPKLMLHTEYTLYGISWLS